MQVDNEVAVIQKLITALEELEEASSRRRAYAYVGDKFGLRQPDPVQSAPKPGVSSHNPVNHDWQDFADLFAAAQPATEKEKALVACYWHQVCQGAENFGSQALNTDLKNLGHGVGNITDALDALIDERPQLVLQLRKSGTSKQARKTYKLSTAGAKRVEEMLAARLGLTG